MPEPASPRPEPNPTAATPAGQAASAKPWSWMTKAIATTFGSVVAPVLVAVTLKFVNGPPEVPTNQAPAPNTEVATTSSGPAVGSESPAGPAASAEPKSPPAKSPSPTAPAAKDEKAGKPAAEAKTDQEKKPGQTAPAPANDGKKKNPTAKPQLPPKQVAGLRPLFNGRDFTGWVLPELKQWTVDAKRQVIVAENASDNKKLVSFLITQEDFSDFRLQFEFKMQPNADSGIALRTLERENFKERMQVQLWGGDPNATKIPTGTIIGLPASADEPDTPPKVLVPLKPKGWNVAEIEFHGPQLKVTINGTVVQDVRVNKKKAQMPNARPDVSHTSGRIGLQCQVGHVEFRKIEIENLAKTP